MNIKNILTLKFVGIVASILFVFAIFIFQFSNIYRDNEFSERLKRRTSRAVMLLLDSNEVDSQVLSLFYQNSLSTLPQEKLNVFSPKGELLFASDLVQVEDLKVIGDLLKTKDDVYFNENGRDFVGYKLTYNNITVFVEASAVDEIGYRKINNLKYSLLLLFAFGLITTAISGRYFANQALEPMNEVIEQVSKITATSLHERVSEGNGNDEIAVLAHTFNKMLERLESSFKLQRLFVANASHEFRTPLTAIKGQIEVLLMQDRNKEEYIKVFQSIIEDINRQIDLLNALRELSQATNQNPETNFVTIPVAELISDARSELLRDKNHYHIHLSFENFPEDESLLCTKGNAALLKASFLNLMDNACKFSVDFTADVQVRFNESDILISVQDKGIGISQDDLEHIFEPFYRSNNTRNIAGFGIGLSLVKKVFDVHEAKISVASKEGAGTTIKVMLKNLT